MNQYKIIRSASIEQLETEVQLWLKSGYKAVGGLAVYGNLLLQAVQWEQQNTLVLNTTEADKQIDSSGYPTTAPVVYTGYPPPSIR